MDLHNLFRCEMCGVNGGDMTLLECDVIYLRTNLFTGITSSLQT